MRMKEDDDALQASIKMLERTSKGVECSELEAITFQGIQAVELRTGFLHCYFVIPIHAAVNFFNFNYQKKKSFVDIFSFVLFLLKPVILRSVSLFVCLFVGSRWKLACRSDCNFNRRLGGAHRQFLHRQIQGFR